MAFKHPCYQHWAIYTGIEWFAKCRFRVVELTFGVPMVCALLVLRSHIARLIWIILMSSKIRTSRIDRS
jgi:hypothetical protein